MASTYLANEKTVVCKPTRYTAFVKVPTASHRLPGFARSDRIYFFGIIYFFDGSSKRLLSIGKYFDAALISEAAVNLGTP